MKRRFVCLTIAFLLIMSLSINAFAHNKEGVDGHDQYMSWVLFGAKDHKSSLVNDSAEYKALEKLEDAVALCIDQYNGSYEDELAELNEYRIHGLPKNIDEIDFNGNQYHRRYSHLGWNHAYPVDKANWETRKTLLLQTVNNVFSFKNRAGIWKFLWITEDYGYDKTCDAFAEFLYCIHILADYDGSDYSEVYSNVMKVAVANPSDTNPDIFYEMERVLPIIFSSQTNTRQYSGLIIDLKLLANEARTFVKNTPDIKNNYEQYSSYAEKLLEKLASKAPTLFKNEPYFQVVFFKDSME